MSKTRNIGLDMARVAAIALSGSDIPDFSPSV